MTVTQNLGENYSVTTCRGGKYINILHAQRLHYLKTSRLQKVTELRDDFLESLLLPVHLQTHTHTHIQCDEQDWWRGIEAEFSDINKIMIDTAVVTVRCCGHHGYPTWSILLTATASCVTPRDRTSRPCSRVCPPRLEPGLKLPTTGIYD